MFRPFFIVVSTHNKHRCYFFKFLYDLRPVYITAMEYIITSLKRCLHLGPQQTMRIGKNAKLHMILRLLFSLVNVDTDIPVIALT